MASSLINYISQSLVDHTVHLDLSIVKNIYNTRKSSYL